MRAVLSRRGKKYFLLSERELNQPLRSGEHVRAFCPVHGGDHTRSLSLRPSGWGFCFNAACPAFSPTYEATVLVVEWNPEAAAHLLRGNQPGTVSSSFPASQLPQPAGQIPPVQPVVDPPQWQQDELQALYQLYAGGVLLAGLHHPLSLAYLQGRRTPLQVAQTTGMGYLPSDFSRFLGWDSHMEVPSRWYNRIIFPVGVCWRDGTTRLGFCGRSLMGWHPGMTDQEHKAVLEKPGMPRRWLKTWPHGWFGYEPERLGNWVVLVEGPFDRCALLAAGFQPPEVIALVGTAARAHWLPPGVRTVVLALDGDAGGENAAALLAKHLEQDRRTVILSPPPHDGRGKDWSERWERSDERGVLPLLTLKEHLRKGH